MPYYNIGGVQRYFSDDADGRFDAARAMNAHALGERMLGGGGSRALPSLMAAGHQVASLERRARQVEAAKGGGAYLPDDVQHALRQARQLLNKAGDGFSAPPVHGPSTATTGGSPSFQSDPISEAEFRDDPDESRRRANAAFAGVAQDMLRAWDVGITSVEQPVGIDYDPTRPAKAAHLTRDHFQRAAARGFDAEDVRILAKAHGQVPRCCLGGAEPDLEAAREAGRREAFSQMYGGHRGISKSLDRALTLYQNGDLDDVTYQELVRWRTLMAKGTASFRRSSKQDPAIRDLLLRIKHNTRLSIEDREQLSASIVYA